MTGYSNSLLDSNRFTWDFWYYYEQQKKIFHVFFLNADRILRTEEKHHFSSEVGYATTKDFILFNWISNNVLCADKNQWFNSSIWTGDVIKINSGFLMFFTSRDKNDNDGMTQNIGAAYSEKIEGPWNPIPGFRLQPSPLFYQTKTNPDDVSIHAWRDPYLFMHNNNLHMLVTAKSNKGELKRNGCLALLRSINNSPLSWEFLPPVYSPGYYSEMEVSQIYLNATNDFQLVYSSPPKWDFAPTTGNSGGLHSTKSTNPLDGYDNNKPEVLLPFSSNLYACRIIPELDGEIVGFDTQTGGLKRSSVKTQLKHYGRDFLKIGFG